MKTKYSHLIKQKAYELGFEFVGISAARELTTEAKRLEKWLNQNMYGQMQYMANHFEKRIDPRKLVEDSKSVVTLLYNYHNPQKPSDDQAPKISQYAYGKDYHPIIKAKLRELMAYIQESIGEVSGRCFVDSAPVLERDWAKHSGVGWIGKNSLLITRKQGSFFFLAELIIDLELAEDGPIKDYCGRCTRCIDACPTQAISPNGYLVDGSKCISYFTIELRDNLPQSMVGKFDNWMFGCDVCQEVCPWNRFAKKHNEPQFEPQADLLEMTYKDWHEITEEVFRKVFKKSAVKRTKYKGLTRNLTFLKEG